MIADVRTAFGRMRGWMLERQLMSEEPDLEPGEVSLRPPSIEAVETEIARCRQLLGHIAAELEETRAALDAAQALAQALGRMLDDARLQQAAVS